ncbi:MAG: metallophosphoesterase [Agitococcus sp.]|nr:metallophosphoesterase [Agitococcus sp.]
MKIQFVSDIHLEFLESMFPAYSGIEPAPDADILVLGGDIHRHDKAMQFFKNWPVPVLYVLGNHEAYGMHLFELIEKVKEQSYTSKIKLLELTEYVAKNVRFLGCTLWTDYKLDGTQAYSMKQCQRGLNDHRLIKTSTGLFSTQDALNRHIASRAWLEAHLAQPFEGKTVVISHHGPHPLSVHEKYKGEVINPAFNSDLSELMPHVDLWLHGHCHDSAEYYVGNCRVVSNPRGYPRNRSSVDSPEYLVYENPLFNPSLVIEI